MDKLEWSDLGPFAQTGPLWVNGRHTFNGHNDEVLEGQADQLDSSLILLHLNGLQLKVFTPGAAFGDSKRRVQAGFEHDDVEYRLWVTDPVYERRYLEHTDGVHELDECYVTISLGEPFQHACHKLVAAIIEPHNHATPTGAAA